VLSVLARRFFWHEADLGGVKGWGINRHWSGLLFIRSEVYEPIYCADKEGTADYVSNCNGQEVSEEESRYCQIGEVEGVVGGALGGGQN